MSDNNCKICNSPTQYAFNAKVLDKYSVGYYQCTICDFVQTENIYWLHEAYANPMNYSDTGIMLRNERSAKIATSLICLFFNKNVRILDYAGGYGVFTRMMRDIGFDCYWADPYTKNILARGFDSENTFKYGLVTTFESFEHFENPMYEIQKILKISKNIIFSTQLIPSPLPDVKNWWYYGTEHGQHIALYSKKTFDIIAKNFNVYYYNIDDFHVLSEKKINFIGRTFLKLRYSKQILYMLYYIFFSFIRPKTLADMYKLRVKYTEKVTNP